MSERRITYNRAGCTALMRGKIHSQSPLTSSVPVGSDKRGGYTSELQGISNSSSLMVAHAIGGYTSELQGISNSSSLMVAHAIGGYTSELQGISNTVFLHQFLIVGGYTSELQGISNDIWVYLRKRHSGYIS